MLSDRTLLVTGGTGSFGEAVVRRALSAGAAEVIVFSRDEKKQDDLRHALPSPRIRFVIGDVRDLDSLKAAMVETDYVFHAAALKQVPSCEFHPYEAVRTNVLGTENVLNAAIAARVKHVTVLSTDKAVYPINAMGLSKALGEKITIAKSQAPPRDKPVFSTARYGNVMASRIAVDARGQAYAAETNGNGNGQVAGIPQPFTSRSTRRLGHDEIVCVLKGLDYIQAELTSKALVSEGV